MSTVRSRRAPSPGRRSGGKCLRVLDAAARRSATASPRPESEALERARAEAAAAVAEAQAAHARLREAIDILPQGIVFLDAEGRYILWNRQYAEIYRRSADLFAPGAKLEDTLRIGVARGDYPAARGREEAWLRERIAHLESPGGSHEQWLADGRCILIEERRTSDGGTIGLRIDVTQMKEREASFRLLFDANPVPMFVCCRRDLAILAVNEAAVRHYGWQRAGVLAMSLREVHEPEDLDAVEAAFAGDAPADHAGRTWRHRKCDGTPIDVAVYSRAITHAGTPAVLIAAMDITERKRAEARVAHMAHHDALTGLPNRVLLRLRMEEMLQRARRGGRGVAALCIDLDNFKGVNDTLGHPCGDQLLQHVACRICSVLREEDVAARLGGDEFAIVLCEAGEPANVGALAERLIQVISEPYEINCQQVLVGASIGIALAPGDGDDADKLLKNADMALYRAKADSKGTPRFFEAAMDARLQARRRLEIDLRQAMLAGELEVHYQPIVDLGTERIAGLEALLRWHHRERGYVSPAAFIAVAEETGLIAPLGTDVLRRACADAAQWPLDVKLAVNLSPLQFRLGSVYAAVEAALRESGLAPSRLELEITETALLERSDRVLATLHALRTLGVRISMDDFGTGYSSLSYLRSFPFDRIKIDRSFVREIEHNRSSQAIVRAILSLGSSLGVTTTAEGIETEAELACLRAEGCREGQGFLFGKARPQAETLAALAAQQMVEFAA